MLPLVTVPRRSAAQLLQVVCAASVLTAALKVRTLVVHLQEMLSVMHHLDLGLKPNNGRVAGSELMFQCFPHLAEACHADVLLPHHRAAPPAGGCGNLQRATAGPEGVVTSGLHNSRVDRWALVRVLQKNVRMFSFHSEREDGVLSRQEGHVPQVPQQAG